jgi:hypothetical protein
MWHVGGKKLKQQGPHLSTTFPAQIVFAFFFQFSYQTLHSILPPTRLIGTRTTATNIIIAITFAF